MFNIDNGYLEGLCRGFKNGILKQQDYLNLVQCETLEGMSPHMTSIVNANDNRRRFRSKASSAKH